MNEVTKKVAVFRQEHFNAAHRIFNPAWDDAKNAEVFGKCSNPNYHGHNYELVVKVTGVPDPETGYVMDMKVLSQDHEGGGAGEVRSPESQPGYGLFQGTESNGGAYCDGHL